MRKGETDAMRKNVNGRARRKTEGERTRNARPYIAFPSFSSFRFLPSLSRSDKEYGKSKNLRFLAGFGTESQRSPVSPLSRKVAVEPVLAYVAADEVVRVRVGMQHRAERVGGEENRARLAYLVNAAAELLERRDRADGQ